jgi:hypothetical protein
MNAKLELRNKVTYNYKKLIKEKSEQVYPVINHKKQQIVVLQNQLKTSDKRTIQADNNDFAKNSVLVQIGNELVTPFKLKLDKRNKRLSFFNSTPEIDFDIDFENEEKEEDKERNFQFLLKKARTKDNLSSNNSTALINMTSNELRKNNKAYTRIVVDDSKTRENDFSKLIENQANLEKNVFENDGVNLSVNSEIALRHLTIIENWIDLENVIR